MRILVVSDSHGNNDNLKKIIDQAGDCDMMFHLGDVEADAEYIRSIARCPADKVYIVCGNNDFRGDLPQNEIVEVGDYRIFLTHGHRHYVHGGLGPLEQVALENNCNVAFFGHTHLPYINEGGPVTLANPGSVTYPRQSGRQKTFMIMDIDRNGIAHYSHGYLKTGDGDHKRFSFWG